MQKGLTLELKEQEMNINHDIKLIVKPYTQNDMGNHNHSFFELAYITEGTVIHTLNDVSSSLSVGDYFIVDYGSIHSYKASKDLKLINCLFLPEIIDPTLKGCCSFDELMHGCLLRYYKLYLGKTSANRIFHDEDGRVLHLLNGMMREYQEKKVAYTDVFRCRLLEIMIITMRNIIDNNSKSVNDLMILKAIQYIKSNFRNKNVLTRFCEEYHYTSQYISRKFKKETGFTMSEYLQKVRIEKSCELLSGSNMPIADIAQEVGYNDIKFFHKIFKRMLKTTPREYRIHYS